MNQMTSEKYLNFFSSPKQAQGELLSSPYVRRLSSTISLLTL